MSAETIWWAISGDTILDALTRAHNGEDPNMIYLELYANTETEASE